MKPWMKVLMWLGIGFGFGFFVGEQVEEKRKNKQINAIREEIYDTEKTVETFDESTKDYIPREYEEKTVECQASDDRTSTYTGGDIDGDKEVHVVPQLHPTQLLPFMVDEEKFYQNEWEFEEEKLIFYEGDEVLYNTTTQNIIEYPDNVLGVGIIPFAFRPNPKTVLDTIYVVNEIFGTRFRVDRIEDAFCDAVDGTIHPDDDPPEIDENDDFWDDV